MFPSWVTILSMETNKWAFLGAPRFWVMIAGALSVYLEMKGLIGEPETVLIATVSAIFITVQTVDRFGDKKVEAADIAASSNTIVFEK